MRINEIIGHQDIRRYFHNAIRDGLLSHAHLIVGEDGIGKSLLAKEFSAEILGKAEIKDYVDVIEYRTQKGRKSIGVDEIRTVIEEIGKKPYEGDNKVVIIYEGDKITVQAQNAFLKTIEEPPKGVYIFILAENSEYILDTIKSRCQMHKLRRLGVEEIEQFISRKYPSLNPVERETLLAFSNGIPGKCEHFIENDDFKDIRNTVTKLLIDINNSTESKLQNYSSFFQKYKDNSEEIFDLIISYIRDILIYKDTGNDRLILNKDRLDIIKECSDQFSFNKLERMINAINIARSNLNSNVNPALTFDVMLMTIYNY